MTDTTTTTKVAAGRRGLGRRFAAPSWLREVLWAGLSATVGLGGAAWSLKLWHLHLNRPMVGSGDTMLSLMFVKTMQENGWYSTTSQLGAPTGQDLGAYPAAVGDLWHIVALKVLSVVFSPAATVNIFFVLGFAAVAAGAYAGLRMLEISRPVSCTLGAVYAWLPYHFLRNESHLFLSAYYAVPLGVAVAYWLYTGKLGSFSWRRPGLPLVAAAAIAVLTGGGGLYYAVFVSVLIATGGIGAAIVHRRWVPALIAAGLSAITLVVLLIGALPTLLHDAPAGSGGAVEGRSYGATEFYGLKITNLLVPWSLHRVARLAAFKAEMSDTPIPGEGSETLGLIAAIGFIAVCVVLVLPLVKRSNAVIDRLRPIGALTVVMVLCATVAGLNSVVAVLGFTEMRAWNRASVVIAFLGLAGTGVLLDAARSVRLPWAQWRRPVAAVALVGLTGVALYDQTSPALIPNYDGVAAAWNSDETYFATVQDTLGSDAVIFMLPYAPFPENPPIVNMPDYSHLRGYLHSDMSWNYAGVKGERADWQGVALENGVAEALPSIVAAGFTAIYVDRAGYTDSGAEVEAAIVATTKAGKPMVDSTGMQATYDLRPYAARLAKSGALPDVEDVIDPVRLVAGTGVYGLEQQGDVSWHWAQGTAEWSLVNPRDTSIPVTVSATVHIADPAGEVTLTIGDTTTTKTARDGNVTFSVDLDAESGATPLTFTTASSPTIGVGDTRDLRQQVIGLTVEDNS